jgi:HTH-type transcriptional regulator / antitoxin HigA
MVNSLMQNQYEPDFVSAPGATLEEMLSERCMTQADLAERTGRTPKTINEIIQGKSPITPETALRLERVLGVPSDFWNNREAHYRAFLAKQEEQRRLKKRKFWLRELPLKDMIKMGYIESHSDHVEQGRAILNFFAVASPDLITVNCPAAFRKSTRYQTNQLSLAAWLRRGEIIGQEIVTLPYNAVRFKSVLKNVRELTLKEPAVFQSELINTCASAGVAIVLLPELKGCRVSGAARWLTPAKPLIQLSFRYKSEDQFWFTFFHEAGHILLHSKKETFIDEAMGQTSDQEQEADDFAANQLIPIDRYQSFVDAGNFTESAINNFAAGVHIAPSIVLGRLQHDNYVPHKTHLNSLKKQLIAA